MITGLHLVPHKRRLLLCKGLNSPANVQPSGRKAWSCLNFPKCHSYLVIHSTFQQIVSTVYKMYFWELRLNRTVSRTECLFSLNKSERKFTTNETIKDFITCVQSAEKEQDRETKQITGDLIESGLPGKASLKRWHLI